MAREKGYLDPDGQKRMCSTKTKSDKDQSAATPPERVDAR